MLNHRRSIEVAPDALRRIRLIKGRPALARLRVSESRLLALAIVHGVAALETLDLTTAQTPTDLRPAAPTA